MMYDLARGVVALVLTFLAVIGFLVLLNDPAWARPPRTTTTQTTAMGGGQTTTSTTTSTTRPSDTLRARNLTLIQELATRGSSLEVRTLAEMLLDITTSGVLRIGYMTQLERNQRVEVGRIYEAGNGDRLECTTAGETGTARSGDLPLVRAPDMDVAPGQRLYYGWGGTAAAAGWFVSPTACTTSLQRNAWPCGQIGCVTPCTTQGCSFRDGSCIFSRAGQGYYELQDGTARFKLVGFNPVGGTGTVKLGIDSFARGISEMRYGDNIPVVSVAASQYSGQYGPMRTGEFSYFLGPPDPRTGQPNMAVGSTKELWQTTAGFRAYGYPEGWAPDARPVVRVAAGGRWPANRTECYRARFLETQGGGLTLMGPERCATTTADNQRFLVSYPKDELAYQQKASWGGKFLPQICRGNAFYANRVDLLRDETDEISIDGPEWPETETCGDIVSTSALPLFDVRNPLHNSQEWLPGIPVSAGTVFERTLEDGLCRFFQVYGVNYDAACRRGTTGQSFSGTTAATPPGWRKDWLPFCDANGVAYQLRGYCDATLIVTQPAASKGLVCVEPSVEGLRRVACR